VSGATCNINNCVELVTFFTFFIFFSLYLHDTGKYDRDRALECIEHSDNYNRMWTYGCEDARRTEEECGDLINNPVLND
jgi:hypothetical protein